jgi:hypothetical protein
MYLKPTAGCQKSTLIFEKIIVEGDLYKHPAVGLRCIIPPRHISQLKTRAIPLI